MLLLNERHSVIQLAFLGHMCTKLLAVALGFFQHLPRFYPRHTICSVRMRSEPAEKNSKAGENMALITCEPAGHRRSIRLSGLMPKVLVLASMLLVLGTTSLCAEAISTLARISSVNGAVRVERGGHELVAMNGMALRLHDTVVTGPGSSVNIVFADGSVLHLDQSGSLAIGQGKQSYGRKGAN
jgi:prepilin-type processing-associated H-X9-DG protein